ncbi:NAD(P)H-quinone oxidoreductase subunit K, chloroplastic-like [Humulus lupulus]|uniref:NAD(P)H-quinone oxidoreductase subunit K, chloroplastic-like n=1 Tax=Humulus lupulus TaxID=3486 RepID=UPI002B40D982|nr:NAD(P)H-quinone oxidoreductase subunit K, chloroplastic-like [Humulus lupulus]
MGTVVSLLSRSFSLCFGMGRLDFPCRSSFKTSCMFSSVDSKFWVVVQDIVLSTLAYGRGGLGSASTLHTGSYRHYLSDADVRATPLSSSGLYTLYSYTYLVPNGPSYISETHHLSKISPILLSVVDLGNLSLQKRFLLSTIINDLSNWSRLSSLWPLLYDIFCCFIEFASLIGSLYDFNHCGLVPRSNPRQGNLILTVGIVIMKMDPSLVRLYEQMPKPEYVIAMGACTIIGGMFNTDSYSTIRGVDKLILVDVYLPECPPKPEAVIDAITKLWKKISQEIYEDRIRSQRENQCFTTSHNFRVRRNTHTGSYNQGLLYQPPSTSKILSERFFKYKSSVSFHKLVN